MSPQIARWVLMAAIASGLCFTVRPCVFCQEIPAKLTEKPVKSLGKVSPDAVEPLLLTADGQRLAYVTGHLGDKMHVFCDGEQGPEYRGIDSLHFSPDGKHFAYWGEDPPRHLPGKIVLDGVEIDAGRPYVFSPDGKHAAWIRGWGVMRDGRSESGMPLRGKIVFSPDSRHCAYAGGYGGVTFIVLDGKKAPPLNDVVLGDPVFAPDSKSYAHTVSQGDKIGDRWVVFWRDKKVGGPYDMVGGIAFSPDSMRIAYRALAKDNWSVIVNDKKGPDFSNVGVIVFSADGKHMAYPACDADGWVVVCDGKKGPSYTQLGDPVFSADGKHLASRAVKDGKSLVICDDRETASFDKITWVGFTANSNHLAFAAARGNDRFVVCDGVEGPAHERLMVPERPFDAPFKLRYVVIDKAEASLVEVDWPTDRTWESAFRPAAK